MSRSIVVSPWSGDVLTEISAESEKYRNRTWLVELEAKSLVGEYSTDGFTCCSKLRTKRDQVARHGDIWARKRQTDSGVQNHRDIRGFLVAHRDALPAIAIRETERKLLTGKT